MQTTQYQYTIESWTKDNPERQIKTSMIYKNQARCRAAVLAAIRRTDKNPKIYAVGRVVEVA